MRTSDAPSFEAKTRGQMRVLREVTCHIPLTTTYVNSKQLCATTVEHNMQDESQAMSSLTGFGLDHVLRGLNLPSTSSLGSQLGISGLSGLSWGDNVYSGQGEDWEDEVDAEVRREVDIREDASAVKVEVSTPPSVEKPMRKTRIVKKLVERPKTVYERFPTFEKGKILDFSELFKGLAVKKSRITKKPFNGE